MEAYDLWLGVAIFLLAALYSSVGHAGASGYLAAMAFFGLAPAAMRPAALSLNILVASLGCVRYWRAGYHDFRTLVPFVIASVPAAFAGGLVAVPGGVYRPLVGVVLLASAVQLARTAKLAPVADQDAARPRLAIALAAGAALGFLAGLTGTGGGIFLSPLILLLGWAGTRQTSGIAAGFILLNSIAGLAGTTFSIGELPQALPVWGAAALAGAVIGTQLGTRTLPVPGIRYALSAVLVVAAVKLVVF